MLRTGSKLAGINQSRNYTGNIFLLVCVFIIVYIISYHRQLSADIMQIVCLKPVLIQRIKFGFEIIF